MLFAHRGLRFWLARLENGRRNRVRADEFIVEAGKTDRIENGDLRNVSLSRVVELVSKATAWRGTQSAHLLLQSFGVFAVCSTLYFLFRSRWLDEWDSVQFAMGVGNFNLFQHTPHPPGYPLYILFGWLGNRLFHLDAQSALVLAGCLGGGLFVACWFWLVSSQLGRGLGWLMAVSLALAPMIWMTATKVLTDMPASAFMALELVFVTTYLARKKIPWIVAAALFGTIGAGVRPQNTAVIAIILIIALTANRAHRREWAAGLGVLLIGCLLWLVPVCWLQARQSATGGDWASYPWQLLQQWQWRLDKPEAYIAAAPIRIAYLAGRFWDHTFEAWLRLGLGWSFRSAIGAVGLILYGTGIILYLAKHVHRQDNHGAFWRLHLRWSPAYFLMIFCCLPATSRYYCPLLPLLLLPSLAGLWSLASRWRYSAAILPALLLGTITPLAIQSHTAPPPPVQMVQYLQSLHPPELRHKVRLVSLDGVRHAQWYAPDLPLALEWDPALDKDKLLANGMIVYADCDLASLKHWQNLDVHKIASFSRPDVIYAKHARCVLYRVLSPDTTVTSVPSNTAAE